VNIIKYRKFYFIFSGLLFAVSFFSLILWGLKLGIDFTGGSLLEIEFKSQAPSAQAIQDKLKPLNLGEINIQPTGERGVILRFKSVDELTHQSILSSMGEVEEKRFESVGPVAGEELKSRAVWAIGLSLIMIVVYIAWAFRKVSRTVPSWQYGAAALVALFHDVVIPVGVFSFLGHFRGVEIGLLFVTALLTVLGFSVHDTIIVFDRIRENLRRGFGGDFEEKVNASINQTLVRSINTSLTVLLTLLAIYFLGGATVKSFALVLIVGIACGTYSSIFIASPLLVIWEKWGRREGRG
jgi:preprotein translocase subunit SecF